MQGQTLYFTRQTKRGKWRLYRLVSQAITSWRGDNDKVEVVRSPDSRAVVEYNDRHTLVDWCQEKFKLTPLTNEEVGK